MTFTLASFPTSRRKSTMEMCLNHSRLFSTFTPSCFGGCERGEGYPPRDSMYSVPRTKNRWTCWVIADVFSCSWEEERIGRSVDRPDGSPIEPVAPPIWLHQLKAGLEGKHKEVQGR